MQHKADEDKMPADLYICLSALLFGISIFCKYEFILFSAVIAAVLFKENFSLKIKLSAIAAFLCAPAASIAALMLQGCGFDVFKESAGYINALSASPAVHKCYRFLALIPSAASLKFIGLNALKYISCAAAAGFILTKTYRFNKAAALILCAVIIYRLFPVFYQSNAYYFDAAGVLLILEFLLLLPYFIKKRRDKTLNFQDKLFILLLLSVILMSAKGIFSMNLSNYGAYFAPAALLVIWLSGYYYLREIFNINIKTALYFIFALLIVLYLFSNAARRDYAFNSPVKTEKGVIYLPHSQAAAVNGVIKYIKENTNDNDRLLVIPEGAMLNYLTDRRSDDKYYYLIPPNIEIFGADNIARDLENNLPDYIIMPLLTYQNFGETYFCGSFGSKVCALLPKYYEAPVVFGSDFWIALYKKTAAQIPQMPQKSEQLSRQKKENL